MNQIFREREKGKERNKRDCENEIWEAKERRIQGGVLKKERVRNLEEERSRERKKENE